MYHVHVFILFLFLFSFILYIALYYFILLQILVVVFKRVLAVYICVIKYYKLINFNIKKTKKRNKIYSNTITIL